MKPYLFLASLAFTATAFAAPAASANKTAAKTAPSAAPVPILAWTFNEGAGAYTNNYGSAGEADLYMVGNDGESAQFFSADTKGVSDKKGDHALDLSSATGMGANNPSFTGPAGVVWSNTAGLAALSGLSSFTVSGWIKPGVPLNSAARIIAAGPITLMAGTEERLTLQVNGVNSNVQSDQAYQGTDTWIFFAVTYDGTRSTDNVTYYSGTTAAKSLAMAGTTTIDAGAVKPFTGQFLVGNSTAKGATHRPFKGLIDNLSLHGSAKDGAGALTFDQIEALRAAATR